MRKNNLKKIQKALNELNGKEFSISEICSVTDISDPTVRNYLKTSNEWKLKEVSYGRYQANAVNTAVNTAAITDTKDTSKTKNPEAPQFKETKTESQIMKTPQDKNNVVDYSNVKDYSDSVNSVNGVNGVNNINGVNGGKQTLTPRSSENGDTIKIHGEVYLNAYLKGFDRGFELGLKKAQELSKKEVNNNNNLSLELTQNGRQ